MQIVLGNWGLEKAKTQNADDKKVNIRMIANSLEVDKENQQILPQAFNKATVSHFLKNGIIDYHHGSVLGRTDEERANAIIGKPYDFQWEDKLPVVYGYLTKAHPIVKNSILPHLEAEQNVFSASIGGNITKARNVVDHVLQKTKEQVLAIQWEHIAVAANPYVVSLGSSVSLVKAQGISDPIINFADTKAFLNDYALCFQPDDILKALTVSAATDSAGLVGMDAMRVQSIQSNVKKLLPEIVRGIKSNTIGSTENGLKVYLKAKGLQENEIEEFVKEFRKLIYSLKNDLN